MRPDLNRIGGACPAGPGRAVIIRDEAPADAAMIRAIVAAAFRRPDEADLVDRVRADGNGIISLVALDAEAIVGHVLFSKMIAPFSALGLGPVSVLPDRQRLGIGSSLIRAGLKRARKNRWRGVFVLGDPDYYRRFGFDPELASDFSCAYSGPSLMALSLGGPLPVSGGAIDYPSAFHSLG